MILDRYSLQTKLIFIGAFVVAIVAIVLVVRHENSRGRDIATVAEARLLAGALEKYYSLYYAYPDIDKITMDKLKFISDQGVNKNGSEIFYRNQREWPEDTSLAIQSDDYQLDFTVFNSWPAWGITRAKGGRCRILKEAAFYCTDWEK